ncbi:hypothetical protein FSP39_001032 [Pinctada imbricata]|uniref:Uncharacterized protein n=1 Tax=Pinctada imbricata TaxID=66713 RepID=A0AA89C098_PINIB|nr:hypothetical protein FSP39_001032 [Pinctada imbricata]
MSSEFRPANLTLPVANAAEENAHLNWRYAPEVAITSVGPDVVTIQGVKSTLYLCFNKKGRLRGKASPRKHRCHFSQNLTADGYVNFHLKSATDPKLFIGFRNNGKSLPGYKKITNTRMERCFDLSLRELNPKKVEGPFDFNTLPLSYDPEEQETFSTKRRMRKIRHYRKRRRHRNRRKRRRQQRTIDR